MHPKPNLTQSRASASRPAAVHRRTAQQDPLWVRCLLIGAALAVIGLLILIPVINVFTQALADGFGTYWKNLFDDAGTRKSILLTLIVAPVAVVLNVVFGLAAAWAIARFRFPGRTILTALVDLPFAVSPVVAGLVLVLIFGLTGYLGPWLRAHDIKILFATPGLILATAFVTVPFVARELIPVMEALGSEEEVAAVSLGATALADLLAGHAPQHQVGPAVWRDPVQRPGDGRIRSGVRRFGPHRRRQRNDAAARGKAVSRIEQFRFLRGGFGPHASGPRDPGGQGGPGAQDPDRPDGSGWSCRREVVSIAVKNISKRFGNFQALDGVSLDVPAGSLLALLGPSGSGKTTLLRIIAGLEGADSGSVHYEEEDVTDSSARDRNVGFVFQHYALFRHMTVFENIAFGLRVRKERREAIDSRVRELVHLVRLDGLEHRYPSQLSGGQRQRVALARALAIRPKVLLLDEPFGALDAKVRQELRAWLRSLHDELHVTSLFVTHDQEEAFEVADTVVVMNQGRVEQAGSPQEVFDHPANPFVLDFLGNVNVLDRPGAKWPGHLGLAGRRFSRLSACRAPRGHGLPAAARAGHRPRANGVPAVAATVRADQLRRLGGQDRPGRRAASSGN